jgi:hypothetical protein
VRCLLALFAAALLLAAPPALADPPQITGAQVQDESLTGADILNGSLTGADVQDDSLSGADLIESSLGRVPSATEATRLDHQITGAEVDESTLGPVPTADKLATIRYTANEPRVALPPGGDARAWALCPLGTVAVAGGFQIGPQTSPDGPAKVAVYESYVTQRVVGGQVYWAWQVSARNLSDTITSDLSASVTCLATPGQVVARAAPSDQPPAP